MKKTYNYTLLILICFTFLFMKPLNSFAGTNSADFGVQPIYPDNQEENKNSYFSLLVEQGKEQTVKIKVSNQTDTPTKVKVERNRATTADSGLIEYSNRKKEKEASAQFDFEKIVTIKDDIIDLGPNESKEIEVDIKMMDDSFDGVILGGLHFSEVDDSTDENQEKQIKNTFSYSIPMLLKMNDRKIENELSLNKVEPAVRNAHPFIEAQLLNSAPTVIQKMSIEGKIYNTKTNEEYYVNKESDLEMAPNSTLNFGFDLKDSPFLQGDYRIVLKVVADGKEYTFEDTFKIDKEVAREMNESAAYVPEKESHWLMIGLIFGGLVIVFFIMTLVIIKKKRKFQV